MGWYVSSVGSPWGSLMVCFIVLAVGLSRRWAHEVFHCARRGGFATFGISLPSRLQQEVCSAKEAKVSGLASKYPLLTSTEFQVDSSKNNKHYTL